MDGNKEFTKKSKWNMLPDLLTQSRLVLAVVILLFIPIGFKDVYIFTIILMIAWFTDVLDGKIARKLGIIGKWAKWDFIADSALQITSFLYVAYVGVIPLIIFLIYGTLWISHQILRPNKSGFAFFGSFGQILFVFFVFWYDPYLFMLIGFYWIGILIIGVVSGRFQKRVSEFKNDL